MTVLAAPKAAEQFIADAKARGYDVSTEAREGSFMVTVVDPEAKFPYPTDLFVEWAVVNVDTVNSRLGFHTTYKPGVRFQPGMMRVRGQYINYKSLRTVRGYLGLAVK